MEPARAVAVAAKPVDPPGTPVLDWFAMRPTTTTTFLEGLTFGEAPRWHEGRLWFSDFHAHAVFSVGPEGGSATRELELAGRPSGLGWLPTGDLLAVSMADHLVVRRRPDGTVTQHADLSPLSGPGDSNDMLVLEDGTAFVGQFGFDLQGFFRGRADPEWTTLLRVTPDGSADVAADRMSFPNGMALTGSVLVVAETFAGRLTAFDLDDDGNLGNRRVWAPLEGRSPDGICADAEGAVWVADALRAECLRVAEGGDFLERVVTSQPCFACALGGEDRRTLFCCTAPTSDRDVIGTARSGRIEATRVDVPGAGLP